MCQIERHIIKTVTRLTSRSGRRYFCCLECSFTFYWRSPSYRHSAWSRVGQPTPPSKEEGGRACSCSTTVARAGCSLPFSPPLGFPPPRTFFCVFASGWAADALLSSSTDLISSKPQQIPADERRSLSFHLSASWGQGRLFISAGLAQYNIGSSLPGFLSDSHCG